MDGANVEIFDAVGIDNIFIFGMKTPEVRDLAREYNPQIYYQSSAEIHKIIDFINSGINGLQFPEIANIINHDPYMVLADFADYHRAREEMVKAYNDKRTWAQKSLMNIAGAGIFAADRAIDDYARDIWHTGPIK